MAWLIALAAAVCLGLGFVLQHHAAQQAPLKDVLTPRLIVDLVVKPLWLLGIAAMVCGQVLGALALRQADVTLVEPFFAAYLLFALALSAMIFRTRLTRRDWLGSVLLSCGVVLVVVVGAPHGASGVNAVRAWTVRALIWAAVAILVLISLRRPSERPILLAAAAGCLYGVQDGLTRRALLLLKSGWSSMVLSWQPYLLLAVAVIGLTLAQSAFKIGALRLTLPAIAAAEPVTGIVFGIGVFGEHVRTGLAALAGEAFGLVAIVVGVFLVASSPTLLEASKRSTRAGRDGASR